MLNWTPIVSLIESSRRILLTTHENPDGDGLGTAYAMADFLRQRNIDHRIMIPSQVPVEYSFLNQDGRIETYRPEHQSWIEKADLCIIFDVGDFFRLRELGDFVRSRRIATLNIDHHPHPENHPFSHNMVDTTAAATGEMVYDLLRTAGVDRLSREMAVGIYTAIMTDTGSFRYNNTTARSHLTAIACMEAGVNTSKIYQSVYENNSRERIALLGLILSSLRYEQNGEVAWFSIDGDMLRRAHARPEDVDGFTDFVRSVRGVEVAVMFFERPDGTCRINFRSKGRYVINEVAKQLGGGGHAFAAGAVLQDNLAEAIPKVKGLLARSMKAQAETAP
ncbi:MAG: bifunctional oligoribonuclease/PAP phosphatase NrnA [Candidatus Neomarinimicrobiota bacterium]|nr:MAG: bifunctional oligoribonuclease/PAP phosphatase NrnA [Candidatus Neomarinimicrobiota bacterium]